MRRKFSEEIYVKNECISKNEQMKKEPFKLYSTNKIQKKLKEFSPINEIKKLLICKQKKVIENVRRKFSEEIYVNEKGTI